MTLTMTHYPVGYLECDMCFWPIAQGSRYIVEGDVARHPICPNRPARLPPNVGASALEARTEGS